ncbi:MAG: hypothetical protein QXH20_01485 [Candidatus Bathyarchaeia archaeon]
MSAEELAISDSICMLVGYKFGDERCKLLSAALYAAKHNLPVGSPRRVFIQDLAAALNRRNILSNEKVDQFLRLGFRYMEI